MKTQPIQPATIAFGDGPQAVPSAPHFDDVYHPRIGALAQAQHVFLQGNGLPARWAGRSRFTILETGFGLGNNFLATWQAWRQDPARGSRLFYVAIERHPPTAADLARAHAHSALPELAHQLLQAWPALTPNLHPLEFEGGRVHLLLVLGDVAALLPQLRLQADAFYLDGFAPARNPDMWQPRVLAALGRKAAPGATLATWSVASDVRQGLERAGFVVQRAPGIGGKREITHARWAPRFNPQAPPSPAVPATHAVVVGAGLAGASVARALARLGVQVTVLELGTSPAGGASGNPGGLFHGTVHADDGPYARLFRAAALQAQRDYTLAVATGAVAGSTQGLLRLQPQDTDDPAMAAVLARVGLPADYVSSLGQTSAAERAGVPLGSAAWLYPGGGWVAPSAWVPWALATPGISVRTGVDVQGLERSGDACEPWILKDGHGSVVARTGLLVLAQAGATAALLAPIYAGTGQPAWPLSHTRGQVTWWAGDGRLRLPVAGDGYALPLPDGSVLCGATRQAEEPPSGEHLDTPRQADTAENVDRLQRMTGLTPPPGTPLHNRAAWRLSTDDRLPIAGALPLAGLATPAQGQRRDQARMLPREPGLFVLTALGARGLTLAPLLGRLVAAQATGTPWPLEQDLADAIDPARWLVRQARNGQAD